MLKFMTLFLIFVCLSACTTATTATPNHALAYQRAKESFMQKNYAQAYSLIQEPARSGNSNAQYALGYMYYYGKGVAADQETAKYWFKLAAEQGQQQAQGALERMSG